MLVQILVVRAKAQTSRHAKLEQKVLRFARLFAHSLLALPLLLSLFDSRNGDDG